MTARGAFDPNGRRKYLTGAEGLKFLARAKKLSAPEAAFCLTLYYTGCRISEALKIVGGDVDREANAVVLHTLKKRKPAVRRIPLPEELIANLAALCSESPEKRLWPFCRTTGWRIIKAVMKDVEITGLHCSPRALRHSFGVRAALKEIPLPIIRDWMGHGSIITTGIYLAVKGEQERALMRKTW